MKVSFVIPSWNHFELINQLLVDIHEHTKPDEIIVVDDCSTDSKAIEGLEWWRVNYGVKVVRLSENLGFLKASNFGLKQATGDIVCLISTDVRIFEDITFYVKVTLGEGVKALFGGVVYRDSTGWNEFNGKIFPYAEGWFLAATKTAWEEFGYFDEELAPHDFEDVSLSTVAISLGYELLSIPPSAMKHVGAQTIGYTEERRKITEVNREKFREKWIK